MSLALDLFTIVAVTLGAIFFLAGTVGLLRFPDTLTRLHALTKADNLGLGLVVLGLLPQATAPLGWIGLIAVWLLALLSGATVGQTLAEAVRPPEWDQTRTPEAPPDVHPNALEASSHD
jgi:multicomponent Na+:H+ antiporter subunit G